MRKILSSIIVSCTILMSVSMVFADTSPSSPPQQNLFGCILGRWAWDFHGQIPVTLLKGYLSGDVSCYSNNSYTTLSSTDRYPGCDTEDIVLANGQVWAACNVGATTAFNEEDTVQLNSGLPVIDTSIIGDYYSWDWLEGDEQGPCETGYHVPSESEWVQACTYLTETDCTYDTSHAGSQRSLAMQIGLKLAPGGIIFGEDNQQDGGAYYWTSTSYNSTIASVLGYGNINLNIGPGIEKSAELPVRCIKD